MSTAMAITSHCPVVAINVYWQPAFRLFYNFVLIYESSAGFYCFLRSALDLILRQSANWLYMRVDPLHPTHARLTQH